MTKHLYFLLLPLLLVSCGDPADRVYCTPNYSGSNYSIYLQSQPGGINKYEVTVCSSNFTGSRPVSIYGAFSEDIASMSLSTHVRLAHIEGGLEPGIKFYVTFNNDDVWFVIYQDNLNGDLSRMSELVRGQFR